MYYKIMKNDIKKNPGITLATGLFTAAAALLVSLAVILLVNLGGAMDTLMVKAETPHFMQMHSGNIDRSRLADFAENNKNVEKFQVMEFLNMDNSKIILGKNTLADSVQDNGVSTQGQTFDYLLDLEGQVIKPENGSIYVPICYMLDNSARLGDKAVIHGMEFTVAGFVRDSQMNPSLSSSKRFLVSQEDYSRLKPLGNAEYLIEFRLNDLSQLSNFESTYTAAGMEANGPAVSYPLFKTMNALSDGMMAAIMILISLLVVAITLICIRFTLLAKIEDDYREIGVMKAVGLQVSDIKKIYLPKYMAVAAAGALLGFSLSLLFQETLTKNIQLYMGVSRYAGLAPWLGLLGASLIFLCISLYVKKVLNRFKKISAAQAIRLGRPQEKKLGFEKFRLSNRKLLSTNIFMGISDVLKRKKLYSSMLFVLILASFILVLPQNLYHTISQDRFSTYLGIGLCDMRVDIQQTDNIAAKTQQAAAKLEADPATTKLAVLTAKPYTVKLENGTERQIKIDLGDHSVFPVAYTWGKAPASENEIALSELQADQLSKTGGESLVVTGSNQNRTLKVCGIYSDVTNGGKTAKATFTDEKGETMRSTICVSFDPSTTISQKTDQYKQAFPYGKVSEIETYIKQTFGQTITMVRMASYVAAAVAIFITILIILLIMKMLAAKDKHAIAVSKALGFTKADIRMQYRTRAVFVLILGVIGGTVLANTAGEFLAGMAISSFGASEFQFEINPVSAYLICPIILLISALIAASMGIRKVGAMNIATYIKE